MMNWVWVIPHSDSLSERADKFLVAALKTAANLNVSRNQIQRWIEDGRVLCDGVPIEAKFRFKEGQKIEIRVPDPSPLEIIPENTPLDILYSDEDIAVINKPAGLTVHPSETQKEGTLVHALLHHIKDLSGIGGKLRPGIVHRIDKDTSGALVITKNDQAHRVLSDIFSRHEIERVYWAFCYGVPKSGYGTISSLIGRHPQDRKKFSTRVKTGRKAITHYRVLDSFRTAKGVAFASWIEARLETGRTHQVRVHLSSIGHSLLGDPLYGTPTERNQKWLNLPQEVREAVKELSGQALHARVLGFRHPRTGEPMRFEAPLPERLSRLKTALAAHSTLNRL